jgi:hypothetical protein
MATMTQLLANPRFLAVYSGLLTLVFAFTMVFGLAHRTPVLRSSTGQENWKHADFDQLTVHRLNIVEPDGTPRLILSDKAEYPGSFYYGKEIARPDRADSAGMLFINDEGTENGGMLFGGYKSKDGVAHSWGHLSFDEYEQDQAMDMDSSQDGTDRSSKIVILDTPAEPLTPAVMEEFARVKAMPYGAERAKAWAAVLARHPGGMQRAYLGRTRDNKSQLVLADTQGRTRIQVQVAADGTPTMEFLDQFGNVTHRWPEK